jgi:hypothetical protein
LAIIVKSFILITSTKKAERRVAFLL